MCNLDAGHQYGADASRRSAWIGVCANIFDARRVEHDHVRETPRAELAAVRQMELAQSTTCRRHAGRYFSCTKADGRDSSYQWGLTLIRAAAAHRPYRLHHLTNG